MRNENSSDIRGEASKSGGVLPCSKIFVESVEMKEQLQQIIKKYFGGELNLKEQIALLEQLADNQNDDAEQILLDEWEAQHDSERFSERNFKPILDRVHHLIRLNENSRLNHLNGWQVFQRIAAILLFPLLLSFFAYFYFHTKVADNGVTYAEIQCPLGVRTKFRLPDGSTGFLNSGSNLKYPVLFNRERSVELTGEAFFDIVHNKEIPFHVNTKNLDIKVTGTTFNVLAIEDDADEEIVLQTGKVEISTKSGNQMAILSPNEQLIFNIEKQYFTKKVVIASQYSNWKEGKLVFRNENMQQVARRISRWYNAEVVVNDYLLDEYTFHATFIDEPLDEVLKLISITTPICYHEEKRVTNTDGAYQKRKIILQINKLKINQFK